MIINVRGAFGSGKTTLVRKVMALYDRRIPKSVSGRKQPLLYILRKGGRRLVVVGHYTEGVATGGCDTIPQGRDYIYKLVRAAAKSGTDVLYEGMLISQETRRCAALHDDGMPLLVIGLSTSLEKCVESINQRRRAKNPDAPGIVPDRVAGFHRGVEASMDKLQKAGVDAVWLSRKEAFERIKAELGL